MVALPDGRAMSSKSIRRLTIFTTGVALGLTSLTVDASALTPAPDPVGNNGTIKVDGIDYDDTPGNEPHVDCKFSIDFFGFDADDHADVRFYAQPPTGDQELLKEDLAQLVSVDGAAGGPNDVDESLEYDATTWFTGLAHDQQGYHVKVEANIVGAPGGAKQKVFWINCPPVVEEIVVEEIVLEKVVLEEVVLEKVVLQEVVLEKVVLQEVVIEQKLVLEEVIVVAESVLASDAVQPSTQVLGVTFTSAPPLARTGLDTGVMAMVAGLLLALGSILVRLGRVPAPTVGNS